VYTGYFVPIDQDVGTSGTLRSSDGTCTFTLIPSTYENPGGGVGPQGGQLMQGSGTCKGTFELDIYPYSVGKSVGYLATDPVGRGWDMGPGGLPPGNNGLSYDNPNPSDFGFTGRFNIESVTLSTTINPPAYPAHYSTITTGTITILNSPGNNGGGVTKGYYAVELSGITTRADIN